MAATGTPSTSASRIRPPSGRRRTSRARRARASVSAAVAGRMWFSWKDMGTGDPWCRLVTIRTVGRTVHAWFGCPPSGYRPRHGAQRTRWLLVLGPVPQLLEAHPRRRVVPGQRMLPAAGARDGGGAGARGATRDAAPPGVGSRAMKPDAKADQRVSRFDRFVEAAHAHVSRAPFFAICVAVILA